ncbi:14577_t:CDS:2, partial [Dentiscutata heterogama]
MVQKKISPKVIKGISDDFNRSIEAKNSIILDNDNETIIDSLALPSWFSNVFEKLDLSIEGLKKDEERNIDKKEISIKKIIDKIDNSMKIDLCFVLDCTDSMDNHIAAAKDCILEVSEYVENINPNFQLRLGFCGYRDYCDKNDRLKIFDFTDSCEDFSENLSTVKAFGGGDFAEDVLGGLNAAITQMTWKGGTRILFHIGDAPPHGKKFCDPSQFLDDDYPNGDPNGLTEKNVLQKMKLKKIAYVFGKIKSYTDTMNKIFRNII